MNQGEKELNKAFAILAAILAAILMLFVATGPVRAQSEKPIIEGKNSYYRNSKVLVYSNGPWAFRFNVVLDGSRTSFGGSHSKLSSLAIYHNRGIWSDGDNITFIDHYPSQAGCASFQKEALEKASYDPFRRYIAETMGECVPASSPSVQPPGTPAQPTPRQQAQPTDDLNAPDCSADTRAFTPQELAR